MSTNLRTIPFSFRADVVEDLVDGLLNDSTVNTQGGNDVLRGRAFADLAGLNQSPIAILSYGIRNTATGRLSMSWGNDILVGDAMIGIENLGTIETDSGNDSITAEGIVALNNLGTINTGSGSDTITVQDKGAANYGSSLAVGMIRSEGFGVGSLRNGGQLLMGVGNDVIKAIGSQNAANSGVLNLGSALIDMDHGDDTIIGTSFYGIVNLEGGRILLGTGNDTITGQGFVGINNSGLIDLGHNDDVLTGNGFDGLVNSVTGQIFAGTGNDILRGSGRDGIVNNGLIDTGFGDDQVIADGLLGLISNVLDTGGGHDSIIGSGGFVGVENVNLLVMGSGNDVLTGIASGNPSQVGIRNRGRIEMGDGHDVIRGFSDLLGNSITGGGTVDMGSGNDRFSAFGHQTVDGGFGFDVLLLDGSFDSEFQRNLPSFAPGGPFGISLGSLPNSFVFSLVIPFSQLVTEMTVINFEEFRLAGRTFSAQELRGILSA